MSVFGAVVIGMGVGLVVGIIAIINHVFSRVSNSESISYHKNPPQSWQ